MFGSDANLATCCAFAVMAKAPRVGEVKTRLAPPLSPAEAAALSGCFIRDITDNFLAAAQAMPIHGYVAYSPPGSEAVFRDLVQAEIRLLPPQRIGLGFSLFHAAEDLLAAGYGGACLVNSDSPTLPTTLLVDAARSLASPGDRVVLGPACDGGYYLIGLKKAHHRLFEEIDWSTERVFRQTLERAASIALEVVTLPPWDDVDDATSLRSLCIELFGDRRGQAEGLIGYAAPHTAAYLQRLLAEGAAERLGLAAAEVATIAE